MMDLGIGVLKIWERISHQTIEEPFPKCVARCLVGRIPCGSP
jgi:hypothetical protein